MHSFFLVVLILVLAMGVYVNQLPSDDVIRFKDLQSLQSKFGTHTSNYVNGYGIRTHYLEGGHGTTTVLIHGAGEGSVTWYPIFESLSKSFHVLAPDVAGYGESDKPDAAYDAKFFSAWLKGFLDSKNITRANMVGSSQGGAIALHFASTYPERVQKLVLVDAAGLCPIPVDVLASFFILNTFPSEILAYWSNSYLVENQSALSEAWTGYGIHVLKTPGGKNVFWQGRGKIVEPVSDDFLKNVTVSTLVVWGVKDRFFGMQCAKRAHALINNSKLVVLNASGHLPFFDEPEIFADAVHKFLLNSTR